VLDGLIARHDLSGLVGWSWLLRGGMGRLGGGLSFVPWIDSWVAYRSIVSDVSPRPILGAIDVQVKTDLTGWKFWMSGVSQDSLNRVGDLALLFDAKHHCTSPPWGGCGVEMAQWGTIHPSYTIAGLAILQ
jgi:hypothetical protein